MGHKKMFVVYTDNNIKKERLYYKATNIASLSNYLWSFTMYNPIQIKELKRVYRKTDKFEEIE